VVLVSGIFPPDIGGPATHTADLQRELVLRGHRVAVLTLHDGRRVERHDGVTRFPRRWPWPLRLAAVARWLVSRRGIYDVVYATGLQAGAVFGSRLAGRPVIAKVVGDAAWERGRRRGLTSDAFDDFQARGIADSLVLEAMETLQRAWVRRASAVVTPSEYLREVVTEWIGRPAGIEVIPNGVALPADVEVPDRRDDELSLLFVGRLVPHKQVDRLIGPLTEVDGARLTVVGEGPDSGRLESLVRLLGLRERVAFRGGLPHDDVLREMRSADALVLASDYEGLPHVAIEALASGLPIVAPDVGGTGEVVRDGENGLVVLEPSGDGFAKVFRRLRDDIALRRTLAEGARATGRSWRFERTADSVESLISSVVTERPRLVMIGKSAAPETSPSFERKLDTMLACMEPVLIEMGKPGLRWYGRVPTYLFPSIRPRLLSGAVFYSAAAFLAVALTARRRPTAIMCLSPFEAVGPTILTLSLPKTVRPRIIVEVHGDWRTAPRLYGSGARMALAGMSDRLAKSAIRLADRIRVVSDFTESLVRDVQPHAEIDRFIAHMDLGEFLEPPLVDPARDKRVLFAGALEPNKGLVVLFEAWRAVLDRHSDAVLVVAGTGSQAADLREVANHAEFVGNIEMLGFVQHERIVGLLDRSRFLVLPSFSEGMGRIILEAFARGRPVVASRAGGIPELVEEGATGLLVEPGDASMLAAAIIRALEDPGGLRAMGSTARNRVIERDTDGEFDKGMRGLAGWVTSSWHG
jgi:glycosyltransferase involved in cell wall biosynthesis